MSTTLTEKARHDAVIAFVQVFVACPRTLRETLQPVLSAFCTATGTEYMVGKDQVTATDTSIRQRRTSIIGLVLSSAPWPSYHDTTLCWKTLSSRLPASVRRTQSNAIEVCVKMYQQPVPVRSTKTTRPDYLVHYRDSDDFVWMTLHELAKLVGIRAVQIRWHVMRVLRYHTKTKPIIDQSGRGYHLEEKIPAREITVYHVSQMSPSMKVKHGYLIERPCTS